MNAQKLSAALRARAEQLRARAEQLKDHQDDKPLDHWERIDCAELLCVLARIVEGKPIAQAFGAPGDWGYSHPIGAALAARAASPSPGGEGRGEGAPHTDQVPATH